MNQEVARILKKYAPAVVKNRQNFVVGQLPVLALADKRPERRRLHFAGTYVESGLCVRIVVEQHPATDVLPLKVTLGAHRHRRLYDVTTCRRDRIFTSAMHPQTHHLRLPTRLTLSTPKAIIVLHRIIRSWYTGR